MKSKLYYLLWLFAIAPLAFISCDDDNEIEEATLEVSMDPVNFAKAGGEQTVTITTNKDKWVATSPLESTWLTLTQSGNQLSVKANENAEGVERKGYILVNAGGAAAKISVIQSAGDVILNISAEAVELDFNGGEKRIDVVSNETFTVTVDEAATWLTTNYMVGSSYFTLAASAYDGNEARIGKIYVVAGSTTKEVTVTQSGQDLIILPFLAQTTTFKDVMAFEEARGSVVIQFPDGFFSNAFYFATGNKDFPQVGYAYEDASIGNYVQAVSATANKELLPEIEKALKAKGFTKSGELYVHETIPYAVTVTEEAAGISISADYSPIQDKDYPTFATLPLTDPQMGWTSYPELEIHGKIYSEVQAWEAEKGGTFSADNSTIDKPEDDPNAGDFAWYDVAKADLDAGLLTRCYWVYVTKGQDAVPADYPYLNEISSARMIYTKLDYAYWSPAGGASYYMTKEFTAKLAADKFIYVTTNQGYSFYGRTNSNGTMDVLCFGIVKFSDVAAGQPVLDFQTFKNPVEEESSAISILTNKNKLAKFVKAINEKMQKMEKSQPFKRIK